MCFFNDTPTPELTTYLHTLSLHDALPICRSRNPPDYAPRAHASCANGSEAAAPPVRPRPARPTRPHRRCATARSAPAAARASPHRGRRPPDPPRSEEHTSELQSLMRISYAVFCLKKNKPTDKIPTL